MDELQLVKAKLEEMKAKYNFERENEDNPNHSDGCGMFYSGFFACLKEISFFLDTLTKVEIDLEKEMDKEWNKCKPVDEGMGLEIASIEHEQFDNIAKHFYSLGLSKKEVT